MNVGAAAPSLPKFRKCPGILIADVVGAVAVALGRVGGGNAPNIEGGSVNTKMSIKSHSEEVQPNVYPFLCFPQQGAQQPAAVR